MGKKQHIGSHSQHAHPDGYMPKKNPSGGTSANRKVEQKVANAKRRRRDKRELD